MIRSGIINPNLLALLARVRHTNTLVIADRGFPSWPHIENVDLSLTDDIPTVTQVLLALRSNWSFGKVWMAQEFRDHGNPTAFAKLDGLVDLRAVNFEPHAEFKLRVPHATGIIRTADCTPYANMILESV